MKKRLKTVLVGSLSLWCFSCYYDEIIEIAEENVPTPENISFKNEIQPLFNESCIQCHGGNLNLTPVLEGNVAYANLLNGYVVVNDAEASTLYKSFLNIDGVPLMPPEGKLSDSKIRLVKGWIDQGALDN
jgi:hypothetical protein